MNSETKTKLMEYLRKEELCMLTTYKDGPGWSIGWGHYLGTTYPSVKDCTYEQAEQWFQDDVDNAIREKEEHFPWWPENGARGAALVAMIYQMGLGGVRGFKDMIGESINSHPDSFRDWSVVAYHALDSDWAKQTPARALRVAIEMIGKDKWPEWK